LGVSASPPSVFVERERPTNPPGLAIETGVVMRLNHGLRKAWREMRQSTPSDVDAAAALRRVSAEVKNLRRAIEALVRTKSRGFRAARDFTQFAQSSWGRENRTTYHRTIVRRRCPE
jgi:hypothetical protein